MVCKDRSLARVNDYREFDRTGPRTPLAGSQPRWNARLDDLAVRRQQRARSHPEAFSEATHVQVDGYLLS